MDQSGHPGESGEGQRPRFGDGGRLGVDKVIQGHRVPGRPAGGEHLRAAGDPDAAHDRPLGEDAPHERERLVPRGGGDEGRAQQVAGGVEVLDAAGVRLVHVAKTAPKPRTGAGVLLPGTKKLTSMTVLPSAVNSLGREGDEVLRVVRVEVPEFDRGDARVALPGSPCRACRRRRRAASWS